MLRAEELKPGDWVILEHGACLVDAVAVLSGLVYIGTKLGVLVLPWDAPVLVGSSATKGAMTEELIRQLHEFEPFRDGSGYGECAPFPCDDPFCGWSGHHSEHAQHVADVIAHSAKPAQGDGDAQQ